MSSCLWSNGGTVETCIKQRRTGYNVLIGCHDKNAPFNFEVSRSDIFSVTKAYSSTVRMYVSLRIVFYPDCRQSTFSLWLSHSLRMR
jgi:hypothetical protein